MLQEQVREEACYWVEGTVVPHEAENEPISLMWGR